MFHLSFCEYHILVPIRYETRALLQRSDEPRQNIFSQRPIYEPGKKLTKRQYLRIRYYDIHMIRCTGTDRSFHQVGTSTLILLYHIYRAPSGRVFKIRALKVPRREPRRCRTRLRLTLYDTTVHIFTESSPPHSSGVVFAHGDEYLYTPTVQCARYVI